VRGYGEESDIAILLALYDDLERARMVSPTWLPPFLTVSDAVFFEIVSTRLHESYWSRLEVAITETESSPIFTGLLAQARYEAAVLGHGDLDTARYDAIASYAKEAEEKLAPLPPFFAHWFQDGWWNRERARVPMLSGKFARDHHAVHGVYGLEIDPDTGDVDLLVEEGLPLVDGDDIGYLLKAALDGDAPPTFVLESLGTFHPFQKATSPSDSQVFDTFRLAAQFLQQLAAQIEVSITHPFPQRAQQLANFTHSPVGDPFDHQRIWLECVKVPYSQTIRYGRHRVIFGTPEIKIHDASQMEEETFSSWPTSRLQEALERFKGYEGYENLRVYNIKERKDLVA